jgi:hypothetical protein
MKKFAMRFSGILFFSFVLISTLLISYLFAANQFSYCGPSGGYGGQYFSDQNVCGQFSSDNRRLVEVRIRSGVYIDAIQTVYVNIADQKFESPLHGGTGGTLSVFKLAPDEYITRISGKYGVFIDSLQIVTNKGNVKGWGGTGGAGNYIYTAPPGSRIHGFFGRSGKFLDAVGVIIKTP